ncbi:MAG: glycyl-radical enzyme activating protein [Erysipelotrichaceae bacterium]|nr:glycyl-radical enzyme activating protein [Erysipelotrichaceae bacterium]
MEQDHGIVFNIQKFSVNDGPGIRTVVFLKGCPLRCRWCANPESQTARAEIMWDSRKCIGCHHCISVCPHQAVSLQDGRITVDRNRCTGCGLCVHECPGKALKSEGELKTVQEVMDVVMQDLPFYEESGGGITLSGGEMLAQPGFALSLLKAAKENGLNTCCETTGYASHEVFAPLLPYLDTILFDVKHWNSEKHKEGTAAGNEQILSNLKYALDQGYNVLPRIPVIPGFNDSSEDAEKIAECLKQAGASRCQLLPFHQFGENKYDQLGREYSYKDVAAYHREDLEDYRKHYLDHGIDAFF